MNSSLKAMKYFLSLLLMVAGGWPAASSNTAPEALAGGRLDDAIAILRAETHTSPKNAESFHLLSRAYYELEHWDDAIAAAQQAVALNPGSSNYHLWLGRAYGMRAEHANWFMAMRLARKTRQEFERAVELDSASVDARSDLAEYYMEAPSFLGGGADKARAQAQQMASLDASAAHWVNARLAEKNKNFDQAESEYRAAIEASKNPGGEWLDLAAFYRRQGDFKQMDEAINKAISDKRKTNVLFGAAELLYSAGRNFSDAAQLMRRYLSSKPRADEAPTFQAHYLLGEILEKQGDRQAAATEYRAALALASEYRQAQDALKRVSP
jgi:tetratricopeptide (TPR) repeat protein